MSIDLNLRNRKYYLASGTHRVPDLLSSVEAVQQSIRLEIENRIPRNPIRVLELGFGSRPDRYLSVANSTNRSWDICLTDFSGSILPPDSKLPQSGHLRFHRRKLDLLTPRFPAGVFDAIISTYVFDSLEFPVSDGLSGFIRLCCRHLSPSGFFLTIDKSSGISSPPPQPADRALFRPLNFAEISRQLTGLGLSASVLSLNDFLARHHQTLPLDLSDHSCLFVTT